MSRRWIPLSVAILALFGAAALIRAAATDPQNKAELQQQLADALKERVETAQRAFEAVQAAYEAETVTLGQVVAASRDLTNAQVDAATKAEDKIEALARYVERMKQSEHRIRTLFESGTKGGEAKTYYTAKQERLRAEIALLRAKIEAAD